VETFNAEESGVGVSATAIAPGYVDTDMAPWTHDSIPADTMIKLGDIVELSTCCYGFRRLLSCPAW
jgi:3-oxoacyl-[acyl-carrier protein] reductase